MTGNKFTKRSWYPYTVAICVGVVVFVVMTHFAGVWGGFTTFLSFFSPVVLGCVIAYLLNPLAKFYEGTVFRFIGKEGIRHVCAVTIAFLTVIVFLVFAVALLIPELISSVSTFAGNIDVYTRTLDNLLKHVGLSGNELGLGVLYQSPKDIMNNITSYITENLDAILTTTASAGKGIMQWGIAFLLSIYLLMGKEGLKKGMSRLLKAVLGERRYTKTMIYLERSNEILNRYIVFNILDAILVGLVNVIFMMIMGLPYVGLVSFVVGLTNLIPTFGPFIGCGFGAFILLLVKPWYAVIFIAFTLVLQLIDGYVLKPKLFGESLGVPGLWILIAIVVGGNMFGIIGILLSIPIVAILNFTYADYFMPWLESRQNKHEKQLQ